MRGEALREARKFAADLLQPLDIDAGHAAARALIGVTDAGPFAVEPVGPVRAVGIARGELFLEQRAEIGVHLLDFG